MKCLFFNLYRASILFIEIFSVVCYRFDVYEKGLNFELKETFQGQNIYIKKNSSSAGKVTFKYALYIMSSKGKKVSKTLYKIKTL